MLVRNDLVEVLTLMSLPFLLFLTFRLAIIHPFLPVTVNPRILCFGKVCISIITSNPIDKPIRKLLVSRVLSLDFFF